MLRIAGYWLSLIAVIGLGSEARADSFVCPLSQEKSQRAVDAWKPIFRTLTGEPRCANCHGAIDPFADNANSTHAGGKFFPVMAANGSVDVDKTFQPCAGCHSGLPGWRLAPHALFFKGKDAPTLCRQQRQRFADPSEFLGHMDNDNGGTAFIATAFAGSRGLNDFAKSLLKDAGTPYKAQPPSIARAAYEQQTNAWIDAQDGKFLGGEDCGCQPLQYAIHLEVKDQISGMSTHQSGSMQLTATSSGDVPIQFHDGGEFSGSATLPRQVTGGLNSPKVNCSMEPGSGSQPITWTATGKVEEAQVPGAMELKLSFYLPVAHGSLSCDAAGHHVEAPVYLIPFGSEGHSKSALDDITLVARVGESKIVTVKFDGVDGSLTATLSIIKQ